MKELPDGTDGNLEVNGAFMVEDGLLKEYDYEKSDESAEDLEPAHTEEVPQNCKNAYISVSGYLIEILGGDDGVDTICILDPDRKEILSRKITNFSGSAVDDYVLYQPAGEKEYVLYNYAEKREITRIDLGNFSWADNIPGYTLLCSSDKGAFVVDNSTREVVLTIAKADTLYHFSAPEGQPYFAALYLSDNGETRLDIYSKDATASPIASIKGGLGMNEDGEVVIYDGVQTLYAVTFLSMDETYQKGEEFLGGQSLTEEQKRAYHCD